MRWLKASVWSSSCSVLGDVLVCEHVERFAPGFRRRPIGEQVDRQMIQANPTFLFLRPMAPKTASLQDGPYVAAEVQRSLVGIRLSRPNGKPEQEEQNERNMDALHGAGGDGGGGTSGLHCLPCRESVQAQGA